MPPVRYAASIDLRDEAWGWSSVLTVYASSRPHQEERQEPANQVQGPLPPQPLHPCLEGLRKGRQAQAESAPWYVSIALFLRLSYWGIRGYTLGRRLLDIALNLCWRFSSEQPSRSSMSPRAPRRPTKFGNHGMNGESECGVIGCWCMQDQLLGGYMTRPWSLCEPTRGKFRGVEHESYVAGVSLRLWNRLLLFTGQATRIFWTHSRNTFVGGSSPYNPMKKKQLKYHYYMGFSFSIEIS